MSAGTSMGEWETAVLRELEKSFHVEERSDGIAIEFWWWRLEYVLGCFCEIEPFGHSPGQPAQVTLLQQVGVPFNLSHTVMLWTHWWTLFCPIYAISHSLSYSFYGLEEKRTSYLIHVFCWDLPHIYIMLRQTGKSDATLLLAHVVGGGCWGEVENWGLEYLFYFASWS